MQAAAEQKEWMRRKASGDALAQRVLELNIFCAHHQASLARKPSILSIDSLATSLVRMTHSQRTAKFQSRFESFLDKVAASVDRRIVGQHPALVVESMESNRRTLKLCSSQLDEAQCEEIVNFFNHSWQMDLDDFTAIHWCTPGCCADQEATVRKCKKVLEIMIGRMPETPLLYRWKFFEPCLEYALRGLVIHRILAHAFAFVLGKEDSQSDETLDEDDANLDPGTRQRVRMKKTWKYFTETACFAPLALCIS